jgi:hypothetical protein
VIRVRIRVRVRVRVRVMGGGGQCLGVRVRARVWLRAQTREIIKTKDHKLKDYLPRRLSPKC